MNGKREFAEKIQLRAGGGKLAMIDR